MLYYSHIMSGKAKRLNESQRLEVISKLSQTISPTKRSIARQYKFSEATIRNVWAKREVIHKRSDLMSEETKKKKLERPSGGLKRWKISYIFKAGDFESKSKREHNMHQLIILDLFKS